MCCGRCRPSACSAAPAASSRSRRRRACRCAASARAARAGRWCCSTACRSTIRSAAGCTGPACRSSASIASRSPRTRRRACTATTRWAASSTSSPAGRRGARSRSSRSTATDSSPKVDFFASDRWNKVGVAVEGSFFNTDGFPDRRGDERGPIDNNANVDYQNISGKVEYTPTDRVNAFFRAGYFTEDREQRQGRRGQRHARGRRSNGGVRIAAAGRERPAGARVRRRPAGALQLPGGDQPGHDPQHRAPGDRSARADQRRRRHGAVDQGARHAATSSAPAPTGGGWTATARRTRTCPTVPTSIVGVTQAATLSVQRVSGGTQQSLGAFVAGHLHADRRSWWSR